MREALHDTCRSCGGLGDRSSQLCNHKAAGYEELGTETRSWRAFRYLSQAVTRCSATICYQ